ncbi:MAG: hypothetical protein NWP98_02855 [Erythrobacter sp.]|nr:hypothetical protein [Erythrobacter sp.]
MTGSARNAGSRGGPLVMLALLLTAWTGARALWWENPFAGLGEELGTMIGAPMASAPTVPSVASTLPEPGPMPQLAADRGQASASGLPAALAVFTTARVADQTGRRAPLDPQLALAHQLLRRASMTAAFPRQAGLFGSPVKAYAAPDQAPFMAPEAQARVSTPVTAAGAQRWSLDAWAFWRQGSGSAPVSQGRAPIYGASQAGAVLQYRLASQTRRDPRLYARAYRALVQRGENELALGASARPFAKLPARIAAEARLTDTAFSTEIRPSAYAVTEIAPIRLPYGAQMEAYGQAGWVGGDNSTAFADGQISATRAVHAIAHATDNALRLSIGAGAWGGAQNDAQRIDLGPTMRLDLTMGDVPARLSLDWRERVGGDAGPDSGLAATLSTRF